MVGSWVDMRIMRCGIILLHPTEQSVLMVKQRSSGKFSIPKGRIRFGRESTLQCAMREMEEETGINIRRVPHIFRGRISIGFDREHYYYLVNLRKHIPNRFIIPKDKREILYAQWIDLSRLYRIRMNVVSKKILERVKKYYLKQSWFNWRNNNNIIDQKGVCLIQKENG